MSRSRRNFSAEFKTNLVLQLLKGEKELNVLAVENDIQPNLLRNWKKEFLANASLAFDNKREDNLREKLAEERKEKAEYAKKVGQLTVRRHIVGGTYRTLISVQNPLRLCRTGICRSLSAG